MSSVPEATASCERSGPSALTVMPATPGSASTRARARWASVSAVMVISPGAASRSSSFSGVSKATSFPWAMMRILLHMVCTSERMWELISTVRLLPREAISDRISRICRGSSPTVGSSRITISGVPSRAWAMPTRCR